MTEQQPQQLLLPPGASRDKPTFADQAPAVLVCALLVAIVAGIAGWNGRGLIGKSVSPGINGLLIGALTGFALPLLLSGSTFLVLSWASHNRARSYFVAIAIWVVILLPAWWASGWNGVLVRLLRILPLIVVVGLIIWLGRLAKKRYAPMVQSRKS
jgi:hypothetical protein